MAFNTKVKSEQMLAKTSFGFGVQGCVEFVYDDIAISFAWNAAVTL